MGGFSHVSDTKIGTIKGSYLDDVVNISGKVVSIARLPKESFGFNLGFKITVEDETGRIVVNYFPDFDPRLDFREDDLIRVEGALVKLHEEGIELNLFDKRDMDIYKKSPLLRISEIRPDSRFVTVKAKIASVAKGGKMYEDSGGRFVEELKIILEDETGRIELLSDNPTYLLGGLRIKVGDIAVLEELLLITEKDSIWDRFHSFKPSVIALYWGYRSRIGDRKE